MSTNRHASGSPAQKIGIGNPATNILVVGNAGAGDDDNDIACGISTALLIGAAGALKVTTADGETVTIPAVPAGILPLQVKRVWQAGTTATGICALYSN